jgi:hypothetical protein
VSGLSGFAYAQARLQSRFGRRAESSVWIKLQNIHDLASYLQVAQQTPLRHWVLGISAIHSSHEIEFTLRQKFRLHIDEVANWLPGDWQAPIHWVKRLVDLPVLQHLLAEGDIMPWMKSDPEISNIAVDGHNLRLMAMQDAGCSALVNARLRGDSMLSGWLQHWNEIRPKTSCYDDGMKSMEKLLIRQQQRQAEGVQSALDVHTVYEVMDNELRRVFRRYAFQPAAVCAYLAFVVADIHRLRSDLMQRRFYTDSADFIGEAVQ